MLAYLLTIGSDKLLSVYDEMPAIAAHTETFFTQKAQEYAFVTAENWHVFVQGLAYPDNPSAEQYLPNRNEAYTRILVFGDGMINSDRFDLEAEFTRLENDLTFIYNR